eukprot:5825367-Pleurochrysis_carterae.AAC.1
MARSWRAGKQQGTEDAQGGRVRMIPRQLRQCTHSPLCVRARVRACVRACVRVGLDGESSEKGLPPRAFLFKLNLTLSARSSAESAKSARRANRARGRVVWRGAGHRIQSELAVESHEKSGGDCGASGRSTRMYAGARQ